MTRPPHPAPRPRPDPRAGRPYASRAVNGCLDVALGPLPIPLEAPIGAVATLRPALSRTDPGGPGPTEPPAAARTPVPVFGGITAAARLFAVVPIRAHRPRAGSRCRRRA
ncbi:hypothetical protein ACFVFH_06025 [Streptomyces sp. NPDC057697]|uniref:hypothetical protein n=1 Tax=Streptomyces sp. NPDC057697 TaxID=3346219 RepID=UPI0036A2C906